MASLRCEYCGEDLLTHRPSKKIVEMTQVISGRPGTKSDLDRAMIERMRDLIIKSSIEASRTTIPACDGICGLASIPTATTTQRSYPVRSSYYSIRFCEGGVVKDELAFDDPPNDHHIRNRTRDLTRDIRQLVISKPMIDYNSIGLRISAKRNLLQRWMIEKMNLRTEWLRSVIAGKYVDPVAVYDRYCQNREPPTNRTIENSGSIGLSIAINYRTGRPSYVGLFFWPWGLWICPVDETIDELCIYRARLIDIFDKAANAGVPIIHAIPTLPCLLGFLGFTVEHAIPDFLLIETRDCLNGWSTEPANGWSTGDRSKRHAEHRGRWSDREDAGRGYEASLPDVEMRMLIEHFGIDAISWMTYMDYQRLDELMPKNPITYSFFPEWKLRWEQMTKLAIDSLSMVCIFQDLVRRSLESGPPSEYALSRPLPIE